MLYMARIAKCPAPGGGCFCGLPLQYEGPLGSVECVDVRGMGVDHIAWGNNWRQVEHWIGGLPLRLSMSGPRDTRHTIVRTSDPFLSHRTRCEWKFEGGLVQRLAKNACLTRPMRCCRGAQMAERDPDLGILVVSWDSCKSNLPTHHHTSTCSGIHDDSCSRCFHQVYFHQFWPQTSHQRSICAGSTIFEF
jgi:hypothetical protein